MLYSEEAVKSNIRNRDGKRVFYLGKQDQLTSAARDWLSRERVEILPAQLAKPERYALLGGGFLEEKPEHMTHLHGNVLVPKTHPRIRFRGKLDTLEAELIVCQIVCRGKQDALEEILGLTRQIVRCEVLQQPLEEKKLCGLTQQEIRKHSHFPQEFYGQPHFMPSAADGRELAQLNRARCAAREAELAAVEAFSDANGKVDRLDILLAMNRISSMLYILMVRQKAGR